MTPLGVILSAMSAPLPNLREFIADLAGLEPDDPSLDGALFATGIIDSLNLLELVAHVEKQCQLRVAADELTLDNWNTIHGIESYVERRRGR
jgi:acyl carrier protein